MCVVIYSSGVGVKMVGKFMEFYSLMIIPWNCLKQILVYSLLF